MPKATLVTIALLAGFVGLPACAEHARQTPMEARKMVRRAATIWAPSAKEPRHMEQGEEATAADPEPAMSVPPLEEADEAPAPPPKRPPATPRAPLDPHRDRCGRPLNT